MEDKVELMQALTIQYGVKVLMALVIFIIGKWVVKRLSVVLEKLMEKNAVDPAIRHFAGSLVYYALADLCLYCRPRPTGHPNRLLRRHSRCRRSCRRLSPPGIPIEFCSRCLAANIPPL